MVAARTRCLSPQAGGQVTGHSVGAAPRAGGAGRTRCLFCQGFSSFPTRAGPGQRAEPPRACVPGVVPQGDEPGGSSLCPETPLSIPGGDRDTRQEPGFGPSETRGRWGQGGDTLGSSAWWRCPVLVPSASPAAFPSPPHRPCWERPLCQGCQGDLTQTEDLDHSWCV